MLHKAHDAKRLTAVLAILCIFRIAAPAQTTNNEQIPPPPIGKLVDVGGYRVHLYCTGSGSPTVVIVGAGFSFNWGLVQPEVAKFTQVCSYDHSGIGWSDYGPKDSCSLRVSEVHTIEKRRDQWTVRARWALSWRTGCACLRGAVPGRGSGRGFCRSCACTPKANVDS